MSLTSWLYRVFVQMPEPTPAAPEPSVRDICPTPGCGSHRFVPGGPLVEHHRTSEKSFVLAAGSVLCCIKCGRPWAASEDGLERPHEGAIPQAWAVKELREALVAGQKRAVMSPAEQAERDKAVDRLGLKRDPRRGFNRPPDPIETS